MTWILRIKTSANKGQEHKLRFGSEDEANAALDEAIAVMGTVGNGPVKIAGKLALIGSQITSADVYEAISPGSISLG
jgi:hypothetical protein